MTLYDFLKEQDISGRIPFHMPGHMRQPFPYLVGANIDFTEIDGLDDLHAPSGVLAEAMDNAARILGARRSFFLVNGSTVGILASVYAVAKGGKTVIAARNCHKSVYNALTLTASDVKYIFPDEDPLGFSLEITPESVECALRECPSASAVIITSPTYDGVVSDIRSIAEICHSHGVVLIVDSAHGAHLGYFDTSVESAVTCGADITVTSLHKTMPSLTQTGLLHISGDLVDDSEISAALSIFETSSPSYILMASIDGCVRQYENPALFEEWHRRVDTIRSAAKGTAVTIYRPSCYAFDESKLIVSSDGYTGEDLAGILRNQHNIEPEMVSRNYVLLLTGAGISDSQVDAVCSFFRALPERKPFVLQLSNNVPCCKSVLTMAEAANKKNEKTRLVKAAGRISTDMITPYPPGIPLIVPGEIISSDIIEYIMKLYTSGAKIVTHSGSFREEIKIVAETE